MPRKAKKTFVVDTNVLLHDYKCIYNFEENDIVIPIVVLEELDRFKRGNDLINFHAREFTRELDKLSGDGLFNGGVPLGDNLGSLRIETGQAYSEEMKNSFPEDTPDHRILNIAQHMQKDIQAKNVILITKDINLRMKAKAIGVLSQDYKNDKVADIDELYKGIATVEGMGRKMIDRLIDSVILIDHLNGIEKATRFILELDPQRTAISVLESEIASCSSTETCDHNPQNPQSLVLRAGGSDSQCE